MGNSKKIKRRVIVRVRYIATCTDLVTCRTSTRSGTLRTTRYPYARCIHMLNCNRYVNTYTRGRIPFHKKHTPGILRMGNTTLRKGCPCTSQIVNACY